MKGSIIKVLLLLFVLALHSCESYLINGELDGFWQVQTVEHLPTGKVTECNNRFYYAFQRCIVQLTKHSSYGMGDLEAQYHAGFTCSHDSIGMGDFRIYDLLGCKNKAPISELKNFGIYQDYTTFHMQLSKAQLILTSDSARIVLSKL